MKLKYLFIVTLILNSAWAAPIPTYFQNLQSAKIDFSRQNPDFGLAINEKGFLLKTEDRGKSFKEINWPDSKNTQ